MIYNRCTVVKNEGIINLFFIHCTQDMKNGTAWLPNFPWFNIKFQAGKKVVLHCGSFIFFQSYWTPQIFCIFLLVLSILAIYTFLYLKCPEIADFGILKSKFYPGANGDLIVVSNLHRIHGRIVINACLKYRKEMFIGVGDIYPDGQHFQIFCQFEQTKMAISRPFWIGSWRHFT